jgi:DUF4097 and DUF4098 domain-containing protein YvlB
MRTLLLASLAAYCMAAAAGEPIDRSIDASPTGILDVSNVAGAIAIVGSSEDQVRVTGELSEDAERLEVRRDGDRVIVHVIMPEGSQRSSQSWEVTDLHISAPRGMSAEVSAVSADLSIDDIEGEQALTVVSGDVSTELFGEDMRVKSVSGNIAIRGQDNRTRTDVSAVSGNVQLDGVSGEVQAQAVSGEVRLNGTSLDRAEITSVSGNIQIHSGLAGDARVRATTTSGNIELLFLGSAAADYDISTFSGEVDNCFGPVPERQRFGPPSTQLRFREGQSGASVSANSLSGRIELCRE